MVVPLSYGDSGYGELVVREVRKLLGDRFVPLTDFLSAADYLQYVAGAKACLMNHLRQQAVGNIAAALYAGVPVGLRSGSVCFDWFSKHVGGVFDLESPEQLWSVLSSQAAPPQTVSGKAWLLSTYFRDSSAFVDPFAREILLRVGM